MRAWGKKHEWPADIPKGPYQAYKSKGWVDWQDYLGSHRRSREKQSDRKKRQKRLKKKGAAGRKKRKRGTVAAARKAKAPAASGIAKKARRQDEAVEATDRDILMSLSHHALGIRV